MTHPIGSNAFGLLLNIIKTNQRDLSNKGNRSGESNGSPATIIFQIRNPHPGPPP